MAENQLYNQALEREQQNTEELKMRANEALEELHQIMLASVGRATNDSSRKSKNQS